MSLLDIVSRVPPPGKPSRYETDPFEDIRYLTGSSNRSRVLQVLETKPRTSDQLQEATDASRVTIGRILDGYQKRGWVTKDGHLYALTELGDHVLAGLDELYDSVATVQTLLEVWWWLPKDDLDFDLLLLSNASIMLPHEHDRFRTVRAFGNLAANSTHTRIVSPSLDPETLKQVVAADDWGNHRFEAIISGRMFDFIKSEPEFYDTFTELVETSSTRIYRCDDGLPGYVLGIIDDVAILHLFDSEGVPRALIECTEQEVIDWTLEQFEEYHREAELVVDR